MCAMFFFKFLLVFVASVCVQSGDVKRNVVMIIADDMGWNDVSFHGSDQIPTPNIDVLAASGVALQRYYSPCLCTPSRAAMLTGKFPYKIGMHGYPITNGETRGLPLSEKILPQYLKDIGYATHLVGKWHVGHHKHAYLPTYRGFDSHFGHRGGFIDYYEYTAEESWVEGMVSGLDLFRNVTPAWDASGYVTDLYTQEAVNIIESHDTSKPLSLVVAHSAPHAGNVGSLLQADPQDVRDMRHVESPGRRVYAAMVKKLDDSVGDIVSTLKKKGILNNTVIIFVSDNGGPVTGETMNWSSNVPFRGEKMTPWEGAIRVIGLIWAHGVNFTDNLWNGYMHTVDLLPTILGSIGVEVPDDIDGINLWTNIVEGKESDRKEFVEIYESENIVFSTITKGDFKLVSSNNVLNSNEYYGEDFKTVIGEAPSLLDKIQESKAFKAIDGKHSVDFNTVVTELRNRTKIDCGNVEFNVCQPDKDKWCLYNILEDPCERNDLSLVLPEIGEMLLERLQDEYNKTLKRSFPIIRETYAAPRYYNYTWNSFNEPSVKVSSL